MKAEKKTCPNCGSEDVESVAGDNKGTYRCPDCSYSGSLFPERQILIEEDEEEHGKEEQEREEPVKQIRNNRKKVKKIKGGKKKKK